MSLKKRIVTFVTGLALMAAVVGASSVVADNITGGGDVGGTAIANNCSGSGGC